MYRESKARDVAMSKTGRITLEQLHEQLKEGEVKELNIILKTDVSGTAEVLTDMMQKLSNDKVRIRVLHSGVGAINETDVLLASTSNAIIVGFNVRPERNASRAGRAGKGRHPPAHHHLRADRRAEARHDRHAGAGLQRGVSGPRRGARSVPHQQGRQCGRLHGDRRPHHGATAKCACCATTWWSSPARSNRCKRFKNDASEVKSGFECGITLRNFADVKPRRHHRSLRHRARRRGGRWRDTVMPTVGVLTLELHLDGAHSLKDKRHTVKSLKDRLRSKFNVAVAEIGYQDALAARRWSRPSPYRATIRTPSRLCNWSNAKRPRSWAALLVGTTVEWIE